MGINKELIMQRIEALTKDKQMLIDNINACDGAIQDCQYWLAELDKTEAVDKE